MSHSTQFLAPYSLCPLIEYKNFLGVSEDAHSDCVIVTLSRNMVIRFRLSDQKQVSSWGTKNKLTAPVVYDHFDNRFIGIFNGDEVAFWQDSLEQLNKLKKFKFTWLIHSIVSSKDVPPQIVYMNGNVCPLNVDREARKDPEGKDFILTTENIEDAKLVNIHGSPFIAMHVIGAQGSSCLHFIPISDEKEKFTIKLDRNDDLKLIGHTVIESETATYLIKLWSNGDLTSLELPLEKGSAGRFVGNVSVINTQLPATLFPVSGEQVAIYGAQFESEGGILVMFSIKYGVVEATENLKIYNSASKSLARSRELIIPSGANLLVIPYKLFTPRLSGLVGSQAPKLEGNLDDLLDKGISESRICELLFDSYAESKNAKGILHLLEKCIDVPDCYLVQSLAFALNNNSDECNRIKEVVLSRPLVGDENSLSLVRTHIPLQLALTLLEILADKMSDCPCDRISIEWACLLLDSHYQQYLLSRDTDVNETIKKLQEIVISQLEYVETLKLLNWEMVNIKRVKAKFKVPLTSSHNYTIETIQLY